MGPNGNNSKQVGSRATFGRQQAMQGLADALMEGLRLYEPASAGLWAESARNALKAAKPFLDDPKPDNAHESLESGLKHQTVTS
jgi:hypothetical protein